MTGDRIRLRELDRLLLLWALRSYVEGKSLDMVYDYWRLARSLVARPKGRRLRWQGRMDSRERMIADIDSWIAELTKK